MQCIYSIPESTNEKIIIPGEYGNAGNYEGRYLSMVQPGVKKNNAEENSYRTSGTLQPQISAGDSYDLTEKKLAGPLSFFREVE